MLLRVYKDLCSIREEEKSTLVKDRALKSSVDLLSKVITEFGGHIYIAPFRYIFDSMVNNLNTKSTEYLDELKLEIIKGVYFSQFLLFLLAGILKHCNL